LNKPFLIIQLRPEDETSDNEFESIKFYGGLRNTEVVRERAEITGLPGVNLDQFAAIIVGGSPFDMSSAKSEKSDIQLQVESEFYKLFDDIVERDFPFLGCCSGNGLLGRYCGANISTRYGEPVGGVDIRLTVEGIEDPLLEGYPETIRVLLGHKEACDDLPPGTVLLAGSNRCPVQMFRLKNNIYATQFHPEGDPQGFTVRINVYKDHGYFPADTADELIASIENEAVPESNRILKRFVDRFRC
jgi:GMP synthase (glutamine-hydrolysing)